MLFAIQFHESKCAPLTKHPVNLLAKSMFAKIVLMKDLVAFLAMQLCINADADEFEWFI